MTLIDIHALTRDELVRTAKARLTQGAGAAPRIYRDVLFEGRFDPAAHGLSERSAEVFREVFRFKLPEVKAVVEEETHVGLTAKAVLALEDGYEVECVHIPMGRGRYTLCISSQVGCKMGCRFCETAKMGLLRHLTAAEIVGQVLVARHRLGWDVGNVVFMGMGEALDNADAVIQALRVMNDPGGLGMAQERFTVCTVGHIEGIDRLAALGFRRLNLSVSLNAANDALRSRIMPVNRKTPLAELQRALAAYRPRRNFALGVNYCLMPDLNDARQDAADVARFCEPLERILINVIPYNPGTAPLTRAPTDEEIDRFIGYLREEGLPVRKRVTKGRTVMAACGQLGNLELRERRRLKLASS
jgi:23S rRNA (adenine2503-C2)-methyltransferase